MLTTFKNMSLPVSKACLLSPCSPDLTQYPVLLDASFSTPSIEAESVPCLGTLLCCCNYAVGLLIARTDTGKSPRRVADSPGSSRQLMPRQFILLMLENAVLLLISQCSLVIQMEHGQDMSHFLHSFIRDVSGELETFLASIQRYFHKSGIHTSLAPSSSNQLTCQTNSPCASTFSTPKQSSSAAHQSSVELTVYYIVEIFLKRCLKNNN